jgi:hypothetical protein
MDWGCHTARARLAQDRENVRQGLRELRGLREAEIAAAARVREAAAAAEARRRETEEEAARRGLPTNRTRDTERTIGSSPGRSLLLTAEMARSIASSPGRSLLQAVQPPYLPRGWGFECT